MESTHATISSFVSRRWLDRNQTRRYGLALLWLRQAASLVHAEVSDDTRTEAGHVGELSKLSGIKTA